MERYFKMADWHLNNPKFTELVCISDKVINNIVHNEFKRLGMAYSGKLAELQAQLAHEQRLNAELTNRITDIKHYTDLLLKEKDVQLGRYAKLLDKFIGAPP